MIYYFNRWVYKLERRINTVENDTEQIEYKYKKYVD